ncbi:glycosyltransferase family 10 domain-containing protein [Lutibacter sp.]|uniref:glycosyltransferase family 10 domain-containing protein n=1 Tax=Lutibacter sp. TaxID=1925666 RepID=UPI003564DE6F
MIKSKIYINILTPFTKETFMRQLPSTFESEGIVFGENSKEDRVWDMIVVYEGLSNMRKFKCKEGGLVFISGEPPLSRKYSYYFLKQFNHLLTSHPNVNHKNNHLTQQALPWHFGLSFKTKKFNYCFDDLVDLPIPVKTNKLSIITSNKKMMPGHKERMVFLDALKNKFGDQIAVFGQGINPVDDKAEALLSYQFCICIENSAINDYWSEKIADSYLGYCIPIYHGCKNITSYFEEDSLIKININNINESIKTVENVLLNSDKVYSDKIESIKVARNKLIFEYNLFNVLADFYSKYLGNENSEDQVVSLKPSEVYWDHKLKKNILRLRRFILRIK